MKTLLTAIVVLLAAVAQAHAQGIESDLDGNASALQASEIKPQRQASRQPQRKDQAQRRDEAKRSRIAAR